MSIASKLVERLETIRESSLDKLVKKIAADTQTNGHTDALIKAATFFKLSGVIARLKAIDKEHMRMNSLTPALYKERTEIRNSLLASAKKSLSDDDYEKLYQAF